MNINATQLPADYALVLQQINADGSDDFNDLAESLRVPRPRLSHIIEALHHRGLLVIDQSTATEPWMKLSAKGKRLMTYVWPESGGSMQIA